MRTIYLDCFSGASGDMILGALIDVGVPLEDVRRALGSLAIASDTVWTERVTRAGVSATKFQVAGEQMPNDQADDHDKHGHPHDHSRGHSHDHPVDAGGVLSPGVWRAPESARDAGESMHHHVHRTLSEIHRLVDGSSLTGTGKDRAKELFGRLAETEAAIHGTSIDEVHLHEVGALDSIVDIVGAVHAFDAIGARRIVSSPLNVGSGMIRSAHGLYPVPAPATARLLRGVPVYAGPQNAELVTPTGALLVTAFAETFGPLPAMRVTAVGYGAGSRDLNDTPNVLRVFLGEGDETQAAHRVTVVEAEIDDMNPQIFGVVMDRLLTEGALDVFYTAIQMKKNRPGTLLTMLCPPDARDRLTALVFRETTTIGVRYTEMTRECLDRQTVTVTTPYGPVRMKVARRDGRVMNAAPEFEDCARIAREQRAALKDVQAAASKAFLDSTAQ